MPGHQGAPVDARALIGTNRALGTCHPTITAGDPAIAPNLPSPAAWTILGRLELAARAFVTGNGHFPWSAKQRRRPDHIGHCHTGPKTNPQPQPPYHPVFAHPRTFARAKANVNPVFSLARSQRFS